MKSVDSEKISTMEEVNKNFLNIAKLAEKNGKVTILKNGKPKFLLMDIDSYFELSVLFMV